MTAYGAEITIRSMFGPSVPVVINFNVLVPWFIGTEIAFSPQAPQSPVAVKGALLMTFAPFCRTKFWIRLKCFC